MSFIYWWYNKSTTLGANPKGGSPFTQNFSRLVVNKNISLNTHLKERMTLVPSPLSEVSGKELFYEDNGPASRVSDQHFANAKVVHTLRIDDFYTQYKPEKIDFIKMDIEGSELPALKGGVGVIRQFRPKLAISIYHSLNDFVSVSKYIDSLALGYKFYLKHGTIHREETVLLAIAEDN